MKQSKKFNKCIKRAIEAAKQERKKLIEYRDTWERAIQEKDRQIETLNNMLTPQKLPVSVEVEKEKPFDEVWEEFLKTLSLSVLADSDLINKVRDWCVDFYEYKPINIEALTLAYGGDRDYIEKYIFAPFLEHLNIKQLKADREVIDIVIEDFITIVSNKEFLIVQDDNYETFQRVEPTN